MLNSQLLRNTKTKIQTNDLPKIEYLNVDESKLDSLAKFKRPFS